MSGSSSDSESTHSSQCDSEYNYIPGYIIDESNYTSHEIGTLEAVDSEILGDYDACLYAGEPLACVAGPQFYGGPDLQRAGFWRAWGRIEGLQ